MAGSAIAQSHRVGAKIPFGFMVANQALSAGEYSVESLSARNDGVLLLRSEDSKSSMIVVSNVAETHQPANKTKLVFQSLCRPIFPLRDLGGSRDTWTPPSEDQPGEGSGEGAGTKYRSAASRNCRRPVLVTGEFEAA